MANDIGIYRGHNEGLFKVLSLGCWIYGFRVEEAALNYSVDLYASPLVGRQKCGFSWGP